MTEKDELLSTENSSGLEYYHLRNILVFFALTLILIVPKIYLANSIYYKSIEIEQQKNTLLVLKQENILLKQELEKEKFINDLEGLND